MSRILTQAELDSVVGLSSREAASILGTGKTSINKYRKIAADNGGFLPLGDSQTHKVVHEGEGSSLETRPDGSLIIETKDDVPQDKNTIDAAMIKRGFDPAEYDFSYRFAEWESGDRVLYAARASATPKRTKQLAQALDVTELLDAVSNWTFTPVIKDKYASADYVVVHADPQHGKTDVNGGSKETVAQMMGSFNAAVEKAKEERPRQIILADVGDGLENFQNTAQQRETNDLDLTSQVRLLRRTQAEGIRMLAPYCEVLTHAACPSNHGQVRIAPQQQASTVSNDWGLEVSHQLEDVFEDSPIPVNFVRPDNDYQVSTSLITLSGTNLGLSHGDTAGTQGGVGTWWQRQAFGWDNPLRDVQILLIGHFHNQAVEEVYEGRYIIFGASSDRGSSWFENKTGRSSTSGMTTFLTAEGKWFDLELV
jgi:hypothetical protein